MDSINLITKRRIKGGQLEQVGRSLRVLQPEDYRNDWDYLYTILEPIHAYEKPVDQGAAQAKKYPPKIFGGASYGVGKRYI